MAMPFVFSTTGRTILDPTRSHLTVSLAPAVPRSSTAPYAPAHCMDNKQYYAAKGVGWDRWADERWSERSERTWMGEVKHSEADKRDQLNRSRQYREYTMQQHHFAAVTPSSAAATMAASTLAATNTTTSYAAIGSHYRSSLAVDSTTAIEPPSTLNTSTFESSSKRLGMDPHATAAYVSCYGGDCTEGQDGASGGRNGEAEEQSSEMLTASYALGYGRNHRHHRMAVNRSTARSNGGRGEAEEKEQMSETVQAGGTGEVKVERIAQGLGYAEKHINYYRYLGRKQPRER